MNKNVKLLTLAAVALALVCSVGCDKLRARDQLNKRNGNADKPQRPYRQKCVGEGKEVFAGMLQRT